MKLSIYLMTTILFVRVLAPMQLETTLPENTATSTTVKVFDEFTYLCGYDLLTGYFENVSHKVLIFVSEMSALNTNNLTLVLENEKLTSVSCHGDEIVKNQTQGNKQVITVLTNNTECQLKIVLESPKKNFPDPMNITILPRGMAMLPLNNGHLLFELELATKESLNETRLVIGPNGYPAPKIEKYSVITDLKSEHNDTDGRTIFFDDLNITSGKHKLRFDVVYGNFQGNFRASVTFGRTHYCSFPITCYLNNKEVDSENKLMLFYKTEPTSFAESVVPWIYAYTDFDRYSIDFQSVGSTLEVTIDQRAREAIEIISLDSDIQDFDVRAVSRYDNPCLQVVLHMKSRTAVTLGIKVHEKEWFVRPDCMYMKDIPEFIKTKYTNPMYSAMGLVPHPNDTMDKDNPLVKLWSKQVVKSESNPYKIAYLLFRNLTETLTYDKNLTHTWLNASSVLEGRRGVCAHFAIAYTTLCIANNLPARYVQGTVYVGNRTYKKNHAWNEIFLPLYGWVSVDVTWEKFCNLPSSHILYTLWPVTPEANMSEKLSYSYQTFENSRKILAMLVSICYSKIGELRANLRNAPYVPSAIEKSLKRCEENLLEAEFLLENLSVHNALIRILEVHLELNSISKSIRLLPTIPILITITVIVMITLLIAARKSVLRRMLRRLSRFTKKLMRT